MSTQVTPNDVLVAVITYAPVVAVNHLSIVQYVAKSDGCNLIRALLPGINVIFPKHKSFI